MKPIPVIGIPVVNRGDLLERCIRSIDYPVDRIVIINNGVDVGVKETIAMLELEMPKVSSLGFGWNMGVGRSWNGIMTEFPAPWWLIVGSDIAFRPGDLEKIATTMETCELTLTDGAYSCFGISQKCIDKIGHFDENFYPAYFEDNDYDRRARLGKVVIKKAETKLLHGDGPGKGSCTIRSDADLRCKNARTFQSNKDYYIEKWGGAPGEEAFNLPFGSDNYYLSFCRNRTFDERAKQNDWNIGRMPKIGPWVIALMPSRRWKNWQRIISNYSAALDRNAETNVNLMLCIVMWAEQWVGVPHEARQVLRAPFVRLMIVPKRDGDAYYTKLNDAHELLFRADFEGVWLWHPCDDTLMPRNLLKVWEPHLWKNKEVIVLSAKRGQNPGAETPHGNCDLIAAPGNMHVGGVTGEQYLVHTDAWRPFENNCCADGMMGERLARENGDKVVYVPDEFVLFNAIEPKRWNQADLAKALQI